MTCSHCESADTIKKETIRKVAQRYQCKDCDSICHDLTETLFAEHQLSVPEMFHIISKTEEHTTNDIYHEIDRTHKIVLDFVHEVQDAPEEDPEFDLYGVCEADEIYVMAGEKGTKQASPCERGLTERDAEPSSQTNHQS